LFSLGRLDCNTQADEASHLKLIIKAALSNFPSNRFYRSMLSRSMGRMLYFRRGYTVVVDYGTID
jgi:hypothetical protein